MNYIDRVLSKVVKRENLQSLLTYWRLKDNKIVFTNGCFDLLHKGHIEYLSSAADNGDVLVAGLNSDDSVKRIKGENRPLQDESSRALTLASLKMVTAVVVFDEDTPYNLINEVQPDVLVKGADYKEDEIVGADIVKAGGGEIITVNLTEGYSTSNIISKISS
ncbi:MAG: D-glycero-beta-D-manno-heptose 1-phosphate adenylyltransferase [Bacteroidota bacterium]